MMILALDVFASLWLNHLQASANIGTQTPNPSLFTRDYRATVYTDIIPAQKGPEESWWGAPSSPKWRVVLRVEASWKGARVFVPASAYAALADPRHVTIKESDASNCSLEINGSDTGGAYTAVIKISRDSVVSRTVRNSEFPNDAWEKTTYRYNRNTN